ncbi:MAG: Uma2 family endonuclease [Spirulinaceae cyanobacterium]
MVNLTIPETFKITHEQFAQLARVNRDWQLELTATGELVVMPPTGSITGNRNLDIEGQLWLWNRQNQLGKAFNSSSGFTLPNGAIRAPDAAWVSQPRWDNLTLEQQEGFAPLCPDFVIELRSSSDSLKKLQEKMQEYLDNGTRLGLLLDRKNRRVEIYRPGVDKEVLEHPQSVSGEDVLPGFILDLTEVWK